MQTLNEVVNIYLKTNGINCRVFADYIGCEYKKCNRWLNGERKLNSEQIRKTHEFLDGNFLKSVREIMKEG